MAKIMVSFGSEKEAQQAISRLMKANVGEVRARNLDQPGQMITPDMGGVEVRPSETPQVPEKEAGGEGRHASASIPNTGDSRSGAQGQGIQVELEFDDQSEDKVRKILGLWGGQAPTDT